MREYVEVPFDSYLRKTLEILAGPGVMLVSHGKNGRTNAMAIGWGTLGVVWGKPLFIVFVRPSRFTYSLLQESDSFTVCIPTPAQRTAVTYCGTHSGRDEDKLATCHLQTIPSLHVHTPGLEGFPLIYECRIVHTNDIIPANLSADILESAYAGGDFHRVFFGEIKTLRALPDAEALLG